MFVLKTTSLIGGNSLIIIDYHFKKPTTLVIGCTESIEVGSSVKFEGWIQLRFQLSTSEHPHPLKFESCNLPLRFETWKSKVEIFNWSLNLKVESWNLQLNSKLESWKLKSSTEVETWYLSWIQLSNLTLLEILRLWLLVSPLYLDSNIRDSSWIFDSLFWNWDLWSSIPFAVW